MTQPTTSEQCGPVTPERAEPVLRYLAALAERGPRPAEEVGAAARYKRYLTTDRYVLPWTADRAAPSSGRPPSPVPADDPAVLGALLLDLLGIVRLIWSLPIEATGRVSPGPPRLLLGRPAPSGGALHPIEAYVAVGGRRTVGGGAVPVGLHHYDPVHHVLERVRPGDHREALTGLLGVPAGTPPVFLVLTSVFSRTIGRYGEFGYRLQCQETGVLLAQALAVAQRRELAATAHLCFAGSEADRLLGLDGTREGVMLILGLGAATHGADATAHRSGVATGGADATAHGPGAATGGTGVVGRADRRRPMTGSREVTGGLIRCDPSPPASAAAPMPGTFRAAALHAAGRDRAVPVDAAGVGLTGPPPWSGSAGPGSSGTAAAVPGSPGVAAGGGTAYRLPEVTPVRLDAGVPHRASPFAGYPPTSISVRQLAILLATASAGYPGDLPGAATSPGTLALCLLVLRVDGVPRGTYRYDRPAHRLHPLGGEPAAARIVGGPLLPNTRLALRGAAAVLIPVGDPVRPAHRYGPGWYRLQQTEVGLVTQRATLAAAALGLTSRIHSEGTNGGTDAALGLDTTGWQSLCFLAVGARARKLTRRVPDLPTAIEAEEVSPLP
ncbi:SagB family peptide dehydrogenase [Plantactinospora sonchi]|uniref:SagB family peptide dehydrogenase n=1 Tax=Plantactinospora sonchi TaxID=1544735 RepID=A0ABU7RMC1_9ACTN